LAPPNGTSASAFFQVMIIASARDSSRSTMGWKRMPPLKGPSASECWTRKPDSTIMLPSSRRSGTCTVSSRWKPRSSARTPSSSSSASAAASND
jgi:hypothetical protein